VVLSCLSFLPWLEDATRGSGGRATKLSLRPTDSMTGTTGSTAASTVTGALFTTTLTAPASEKVVVWCTVPGEADCKMKLWGATPADVEVWSTGGGMSIRETGVAAGNGNREAWLVDNSGLAGAGSGGIESRDSWLSVGGVVAEKGL
jgi:hypothetical protein